MPYDSGYKKATENLHAFIKEQGELTQFEPGEMFHRRGHFPAVNFGISQGNGKAEATTLNTGRHTDLINRILANPDLQRIASFADSTSLSLIFRRFSHLLSGAFQLWAPRLYGYYKQTMDKLYEKTRQARNFPGSIFACATVNFGPRVRSFKHRDMLNLAHGWCAITAIGDYNPKLGGHLVCEETRTVIEFPPGSTFLIPSSCVTHSNTDIQDGEFRASFIQYTAGGVFRWVENDFRTDNEFEAEDPIGFELKKKQRKENWKNGVRMYSTMDELLKPL